MAKTTKKRTARSKNLTTQHKSRAGSKDNSSAEPRTRSSTKQDRAISMLRLKQGASIATLMEATGWQQHSVRGFLAGVVRKRLKLNLVSEIDAGVRTYRIIGEAAASSSKGQVSSVKSN